MSKEEKITNDFNFQDTDVLDIGCDSGLHSYAFYLLGTKKRAVLMKRFAYICKLVFIEMGLMLDLSDYFNSKKMTIKNTPMMEAFFVVFGEKNILCGGII